MTARELHLQTVDADDTRKLAATVAGALRAGDVIALTGELGAGKTCFVQGAAAALGVDEPVTSPSFVLRREYAGSLPILHLDVYRLETLQEVVEVGYDEAFDGSHVTFIEWGDAMSPLLPAQHLEVEFHLADDDALDGDPAEPQRRRLVVRPHGDDWLRRIVGLSVDLVGWRAEAPPTEGA